MRLDLSFARFSLHCFLESSETGCYFVTNLPALKLTAFFKTYLYANTLVNLPFFWFKYKRSLFIFYESTCLDSKSCEFDTSSLNCRYIIYSECFYLSLNFNKSARKSPKFSFHNFEQIIIVKTIYKVQSSHNRYWLFFNQLWGLRVASPPHFFIIKKKSYTFSRKWTFAHSLLAIPPSTLDIQTLPTVGRKGAKI